MAATGGIFTHTAALHQHLIQALEHSQRGNQHRFAHGALAGTASAEEVLRGQTLYTRTPPPLERISRVRRLCHALIRSRPGKPNQRKGQNVKFMNFAHFYEFWCFSLGKQARFTLNFCSGMPPGKVHELAFLWFGSPGPLLT